MEVREKTEGRGENGRGEERKGAARHGGKRSKQQIWMRYERGEERVER